MSKFIFSCVDTDTQQGTKTTQEFTAFDVSTILENLEFFLKGCGFSLKGPIEVIDDNCSQASNGYNGYDLGLGDYSYDENENGGNGGNGEGPRKRRCDFCDTSLESAGADIACGECVSKLILEQKKLKEKLHLAIQVIKQEFKICLAKDEFAPEELLEKIDNIQAEIEYGMQGS